MVTVIRLPEKKGGFSNALSGFLLAQTKLSKRNTLIDLLESGGSREDVIEAALKTGATLPAALQMGNDQQDKNDVSSFNAAVAELEHNTPAWTSKEGLVALADHPQDLVNTLIDNKRSEEARIAAAKQTEVVNEAAAVSAELAASRERRQVEEEKRAVEDQQFQRDAEARAIIDQRLQEEAAERKRLLDEKALATLAKPTESTQLAIAEMQQRGLPKTPHNISLTKRVLKQTPHIQKLLAEQFRREEGGVMLPRTYEEETTLAIAQGLVKDMLYDEMSAEEVRVAAKERAELIWDSGTWIPDSVFLDPATGAPLPKGQRPGARIRYLAEKGVPEQDIMLVTVRNAAMRNDATLENLRQGMTAFGLKSGKPLPEGMSAFEFGFQLYIRDVVGLGNPITNLDLSSIFKGGEAVDIK